MMHHHHPIPQSQLQRGDPNRMGQQTHRLLQNQQRGHPPIMLGVAGASPVPPPDLSRVRKKFSGKPRCSLLNIIFLSVILMSTVKAMDLATLSKADLQKIFGELNCIEGVIVTMPSVPLQAMTQSVHQQQAQTVQQSQTPQQVMHSQQPQQQVQLDMENNQVDNSKQTNTLTNTTVNQQSSNQQQNIVNNNQNQQQQHNTTMGSGASSSLPSGTTNTLNSAPTATADNSSSAPASSSLANIKEKTPMCLINELARFNKIQHQYRLTGESGPAHKKRFTVSLKLGTEEYEAEGNSIKKAQHAAAKEALLLTKLKHPPPKTSRNLRLGVNGYNPGYHRGNIYNQQGNRFNYDTRRYNGRGHYHGHFDNQHPGNAGRYQGYAGYGKPHGWHGPGNPGDTFTVTLRVGPRGYTGEGPTAQAARHDAASRALQELRHLPLPDSAPADQSTFPVNGATENGNQSTNAEDINYELKSPISLVHEIALKRNLNVSFEVQSEKGLPHMKVFVTTCTVGDMVTEGEGNGKKISKKRAAEKMLDELKKLPPLSPTHMFSMSRLKRKPAVPKKKTRSLIKVFQNEPDYTEEINPISRLIQIQQAKKEKEPVYNLLEERGAARRREFVMEVTVGQHSATGTGTNKKLAKRAAAEALLQQLGYNQQTPAQNIDKTNVNVKPAINTQQQEIQEKQRKVTFLEDKTESQPQGGTSGRQLVPGLLLMGDQSNNTFSAAKSGVNIQTTATIAKEFLKAGNSPTADALAKAGHNTKIMSQGGDQSQMTKTSSTQVFRPKQQLLYLSKLLNFQVQFSDFPKANHEEFLTLLSLSTDPPQVCHGAGDSTDESHDQAALSALRVLSEMGLDNKIQLENKKDTQNGMVDGHNPKSCTKPSILSNGIKK
ncbi:double-stranded RNA-binding protein Staufen homolog 2 isoform X2 [Chrysoperla carnea]|uniref:double-stranded RNA-binding protein Staufen homolog 2 isoform X2 n=1 Tax=Chrysoperla carnea TaxID=189513 RepID=UPI001D07B4A8|nr:double-stranded RNA-binding protein Staufen homolog 2 isoform X2 [Chrysoperla carnea]